MKLNSKEDYLHLIEKLCKPLLKYYDETNLPLIYLIEYIQIIQILYLI